MTTDVERRSESSAPSSSAAPRHQAGVTPGGRLEHEPALDGMRTLAVYLVVGFHCGLGFLKGGFIGVDVFFVLSGYLVTRLIVANLDSGTFSWRVFYGRRIRRLLPAALLCLVAVCLTWWLVASSVDRRQILPDIRSAALDYANWHFAAQATDYFAQSNDPTPVLHFWSLSVEEQFYVFWPLLLVGVWRLNRGRRQRAAVLACVTAGVLVVASLIALIVTLAAGAPDLAYYGTHTRIYQLLGGGLLGIGVQLWKWAGPAGRWQLLGLPVQLLATAAIVVLAVCWPGMDPSVRGIGTAAAAVALLATFESAPRGPITLALGRGPVAYLGQISYGTYLWHYPLIVVIGRFAAIGSAELTAVVVVLATGMAALSHRILELPVRHSRALSRRPRTTIAGGIAMSLIVALIIAPWLLDTTGKPTVQAEVSKAPTTSGPRISLAGFDIDAGKSLPADLTLAQVHECPAGTTYCVVVDGGPTAKKVMLLGDSHASMLTPPVEALAIQEHFTLAVAVESGCPWAQGLVFNRSDRKICANDQTSWYDVDVPRFAPDVLLLSTRSTDQTDDNYLAVSMDPSISGDTDAVMIQGQTRTLEALSKKVPEVVVFEPTPVDVKKSVADCVAASHYADQCTFTVPHNGAPGPARLATRTLATQLGNVADIDLDSMICPRYPLCDPTAGDTLVFADHDHVTPRYAYGMTGELDVALHQHAVL